ncbi:IclR family transcriptional regulator C-terminal domain-containing protein [Sphaerisporangium sp. NPDC051017]|uniref:IclR family transcriptional regulator domain-containing protein n=1 Tax=Sphaerisporangium sp. NPDC051017 TaxID=3154636 RepID=UPI003413D8FB
MLTPTVFTLVDIAFGANRADDVRRHGWPVHLDSPAVLATAAGRILLADRLDVAERLRSRPLPRFTRQTLTSWRGIERELQAVRDTGTAIEHEELRAGFSCVATGLRDPGGTLIGTIGVCGRTNSFAPGRLAGLLHAAAKDITRMLTTHHDARQPRLQPQAHPPGVSH